jgi:acetyl esterase/lipase
MPSRMETMTEFTLRESGANGSMDAVIQGRSVATLKRLTAILLFGPYPRRAPSPPRSLGASGCASQADSQSYGRPCEVMKILKNRMSARRAFATVLLVFGALFAVGCASYAPARKGETNCRKLLFASPQGHKLYMDLYVPQSAQLAPVVIWIFGGSWKYGSNGYHLNVRDLTASGIAIASIQYRTSGTARYPAQLEDCRAAARWLRANGVGYGIDPTRIGASGESAGGHLAALLGTVEGAPSIRAVCALYPPTDLVALGRMYETPDHSSDIDKLLGGSIDQKLALAKEASPVNHVTASSPPFLIFHGEDDTLVPLAQSQELQRRLICAGVQSRLIVVPGQGHWFLLNRSQIGEVARFFNRSFATAR